MVMSASLEIFRQVLALDLLQLPTLHQDLVGRLTAILHHTTPGECLNMFVDHCYLQLGLKLQARAVTIANFVQVHLPHKTEYFPLAVEARGIISHNPGQDCGLRGKGMVLVGFPILCEP